jgi:hypothetical protein
MARFLLRALLAATLAFPAAPASGARGSGSLLPLAVVAHPEVPATSLDADDVRRIFLMRRRLWRDGSRVFPVNLPATSATRLSFSRAMLGRTPRELTEYFNDLYFHGTRPPPVLESDEAVLLYVARTRGAVGYVSAGALAGDGGAGVKVLLTFDAR